MKRVKYRFPEDIDKAPEGVWIEAPDGVDVVIHDLTTDPPTLRFVSRSSRKGGAKPKSAKGASAIRAAKGAATKAAARRLRAK